MYLLKKTFPIVIYWIAVIASIITLYDFLKKPHSQVFYWSIILLISILATIYIYYLIYRYRVYEILLAGDKDHFTTAIHFLNNLRSSGSINKNWDLIVNKLLLSDNTEAVESAKSFLNHRAKKNPIDLFHIFERQDKKLQSKYFNEIINVIEDEDSDISNNMIEAILTRISKAMLENPYENLSVSLFAALYKLWSRVRDKAPSYQNSEMVKHLKEFLNCHEYPISTNFLEFHKDFFNILVDIDGPNIATWTEERFKFFKEKANKPEGTLDCIFFTPIAKSLASAHSAMLTNISQKAQK